MPDPVPNLNQVVLDALDLHTTKPPQKLEMGSAKKRLIVASGNALPTGKIIFADENAIFADEGQYEQALALHPDIDSAVVISSSGTKHAPILIRALQKKNLDPWLLTCSPDSPAAKLLDASRISVTASRPEPITYNTSTYLGMILSKTGEDAAGIKAYIQDTIDPLIPTNMPDAYSAFYLMVPPQFDVIREMLVTKFDELFGPRIIGRCYTTEQTKHAKTVVTWERELFLNFEAPGEHDVALDLLPVKRLTIPLMNANGFGSTIAIAYYVIGHIQEQYEPYFAKSCDDYKELQPRLFD